MKSGFVIKGTALLLILVCLMGALPALGEAYPFVGFAADSVRMRQQPSDQSTVLKTIPAGDALVVTGEMGAYYIALYMGAQGYVLKSYVRLNQAVSMTGPVVTSIPQTEASPYALLYAGSQGSAVSALQEALKELGFYSGKTDGAFGTGTKNAVLAFQKKNNLPQTGTADGTTQTLLYEGKPLDSRGQAVRVKTVAPVTGALISSGSRGQAVEKLQQRLKELGYYKGTVDGICGSGTESAIRAFQKKVGMTANGQANAATQTALYAANAPLASATATPRPTLSPSPLPTNIPSATAAPTFPFASYTLAAVNLRKNASTTATRLLTVPKGAEITVLALEEDYLKITYEGKTGYIVAQYGYVPPQYAPGNSLKEDDAAQQKYPNLRSGASGDKVAVLQEALKELGFYTGALDGSYSVATIAAVKSFQKKNDIKQDGIATPEVQQLIYEGRPRNARGTRVSVKVLPPVPGCEMRLNDVGDAVTQLQSWLKALGYYKGELGRTFNTATQKAVRAFQQEHNLYVDGVAGQKTLRLLSALGATPAPTTMPGPGPSLAPANTPLTENNVIVMQNGTRGVAVRQLQLRLMELGYYTCQADGIYDSDDIAALREFQRKNGLKIDGIAGLATQQLLYSVAALPATSVALPPPTESPAPLLPTAPPASLTIVLQTGSRGQEVVDLQSRLKLLGYYAGNLDGQFGTGTAQALIRFQRANGLTADGVAGSRTLDKLYSGSAVAATATKATPAPTTTLSVTLLERGDSGAAVKTMQQRLVTLGYLNAADGIYGVRTYNAIVAFQKRNGLTADGVAGKMTLNRLNSSAAIAAQGSIINPPAVTPSVPSGGGSRDFTPPAASEVRFANWYTEIRARAKLMPDVVIYDPESGLHFNLHMFSFGKHADVETPTQEDTRILYEINGESNWDPKYVWVMFPDGRVYIASTHSNGHEVDHTKNNGVEGHFCLHFPRIMSEAEATGPYAVSHQKEILWGWELTQAAIQ